MILRPILNRLLPSVSPTLQQNRNVRPTVKIGKDLFQITINVNQFSKKEIRVKARAEYVSIEGKQERETNRGYVVRQFTRKFKLPQGCDPKTIKSKLSPDGTLTITAPRKYCEINLPCEMSVPITLTTDIPEESMIEVKSPDRALTSAECCSKLIEECKKRK